MEQKTAGPSVIRCSEPDGHPFYTVRLRLSIMQNNVTIGHLRKARPLKFADALIEGNDPAYLYLMSSYEERQNIHLIGI